MVLPQPSWPLLVISHHIKLTGEYQDCDADNHGTVVTTGPLSGVDMPLRDSTEAEVENLTLTESGKVTSVDKNDNSYFVYDKTDLAASMTNMNRIDYYIRFANSERLRGYKFNAYVYLIVDGTIIVSKEVSAICIDECGTGVYE